MTFLPICQFCHTRRFYISAQKVFADSQCADIRQVWVVELVRAPNDRKVGNGYHINSGSHEDSDSNLFSGVKLRS